MKHQEKATAPDDGAALLDTKAAAKALGMRPQTLHDWRCRGVGPPYYRLGGRTIRYRLGDLNAWIEGQAVVPVRVYPDSAG